MDKVFFIDVDNTLLNNDHLKEDIKKALDAVLGEEEADNFWRHHDKFRERTKLVDFPNIIREYCAGKHPKTCEQKVSAIFDNVDFKHALFPHVPEVMRHLKHQGRVVIFSEGDSVYQKAKIEKSGLAEMADEVMLFEHKSEHLEEALERYKGYEPVFIDDKADFLARVKALYPEAYVVEVCQGHYCVADHTTHKKLDRTVNSISELINFKT